MERISSTNELLSRVKKFVVEIIELVNNFPKTTAGFRIGGQLVDSAGSMGANLNEAQASRSKKEFVSIIGIILKENKETSFWLEIIILVKLGNINEASRLLRESKELERIFAQIIISCNKNLKKDTRF